MEFIVITGLSGSGKSHAANILEDMGFFCVDNMPPMLIPKFVEMFMSSGKIEKIAVVVDIRVGDMLKQLIDELHRIKTDGCDYTLIFMDADEKELVKRYKETRRTHPIASDKGLLDSIRQERRLLEKLYCEADYIIDTSKFVGHDLRQQINDILVKTPADVQGIKVNVMSFGFKYGMPLDADLVFDVRCFPNPFYVDELKQLTGNDVPVQNYVMGFSDTQVFLDKLFDMMVFMLPLYHEEGKHSLTIAIGCTGGKHRSVTLANKLADRLSEKDYDINVNHRDVQKGR